MLVLGALYGAAMVGVAGYRARAPQTKGVGTSDFVTFHVTARHFLKTGRIIPDAGVRNYLPFFTVLMVPPAVFPCWLGAAIMAALSAGSLVLSLVMITRALAPPHPAPPLLRIGVPVLMTLPFVHACLVLGQVSILVGMLCLLTWWLVVMRHPWSAGLPLALALLVKPFLLTLVVFFVLKRQWRTVLATMAWVVVLGGGLTFAVMKPQAWLDAHRDYLERVIRGNTPLALIAAEKPRYARSSNQSLAVVLRRLLTDTPAGSEKKPFKVNWTRCGPRVPQAVFIVIMGILAGVTLAVGRHPFERIEPERACIEFALFLLWGLLTSPILWTHYLPLALYPLVLLTLQLMHDGDLGRPNRLGLAAWAFWIAAALSLGTEAFTQPYLRAVGVHLWATLFLWVAMAACALRHPPTRTMSS
jgi:hypothetical protein